MELEEIFAEWNKDSVINEMDLGSSALEIPRLHNKYLKYLSTENKILRKFESQYKKLVFLKTEYYSGVLNGTDELDKLGWEPFKRTLLKQDIPKHVESDTDVQKMIQYIGEQKEKVEVLNSIMKEIMSRNFIIKSAIDWRKFTEGVI